ncbi:MAG: hypothetical protein M3Q07_13750 [Pseudobdellovibrionaceae bacterium]|nr:hypothetical protein [Pseudobdellovibrionaceae bacterium]
MDLLWKIKNRDIRACADALEIEFESFLQYNRTNQEALSGKYLTCITEAHRIISEEPVETSRTFAPAFHIMNVSTMFMRAYLGFPVSQLAQKGYEVSNIVDRSWQSKVGSLRQLDIAEDGEVWGINDDQGVFRWTGTGWVQPAPLARLSNITVGSRNNIWGVNSAGAVFKWNGSTWIQPTAPARLRRISAAADGTVWGVSSENSVFRWTGSTWVQPSPSARLVDISVGSANVIWGVAADGAVWKWDGASFFQPAPRARLVQISAGSDGEVWGVNAGVVYRLGGATWYQPNGDARLGHVSVVSKSIIWGTGLNASVWSRDLTSPRSLFAFYSQYR